MAKGTHLESIECDLTLLANGQGSWRSKFGGRAGSVEVRHDSRGRHVCFEEHGFSIGFVTMGDLTDVDLRPKIVLGPQPGPGSSPAVPLLCHGQPSWAPGNVDRCMCVPVIRGPSPGQPLASRVSLHVCVGVAQCLVYGIFWIVLSVLFLATTKLCNAHHQARVTLIIAPAAFAASSRGARPGPCPRAHYATISARSARSI